MQSLDDRTRIHCVGVGGAGMGPLAKLLAAMGHDVSGSDLDPGSDMASLRRNGVESWSGSRPDRMAACDLVVASSAVPDTDPELLAALAAEAPVWRRPRLLAALTGLIPTIGITGTHGKTTTTAMAITAMRSMGADPSFVVGGDPIDPPTNAHLGADDLLVLEADEAFETFKHLRLSGLVVTNVDSDHLDHYGTTARLEQAFRDVVDGVDGPVVVGADDRGGRRLIHRTGRPGYGTSADAEWRITDVVAKPTEVCFSLAGRFPPTRVTVGRPGLHTARNACGVLALLAELGYRLDDAITGLARFRGVRRRLEFRGVVAGVTVVDSYAHHPSEVAADIEALSPVGRNRLWVVFQPHLYSRTLALASEFGVSLARADQVVVTDVYGAREDPIPGVTGALVSDAARQTGTQADYLPGLDEVSVFLANRVSPNDVVLTLGAGDISSLPEMLIGRLREKT